MYLQQYGIMPLSESAMSFASGEIISQSLMQSGYSMENDNNDLLAQYIKENEFSTIYGKVMSPYTQQFYYNTIIIFLFYFFLFINHQVTFDNFHQLNSSSLIVQVFISLI